MKCRLILLVLLAGLPSGLGASDGDGPAGAEPRAVERQWLFALGRVQLLDTYLSPLDYAGPSLGLVHATTRAGRARRLRGWDVVARYGLRLGRGRRPSGGSGLWDAGIDGAGGLLHRVTLRRGFRLGFGAMAGACAGAGYRPGGGNNTASAHVAAALEAVARADGDFRLGRLPVSARAELSAPLAGVRFAPAYGQSYYEMFVVGSRRGTLRLTHPLNAPSLRAALTLGVPLGRSRITAGYEWNVVQSRLCGLKYHAWEQRLMVGFTRRLQLLSR